MKTFLRRRLDTILAIVFATTGCAAAWPASAGAADELPRYKLKVGQQIDYQEKSEFKFKSGVFNEDNQWTFWVVRQNDDGNWRAVFHMRRSRVRIDSEYEPETSKQQSDSYGYFDLYADGRVAQRQGLSIVRPDELFPRLPDGPMTTAISWKSTSNDGTTRNEFTVAASTLGSTAFSFDAEQVQEDWDPIYLSSHEFSYVFDIEKGLVRSVRTTRAQGWGGFVGSGTGTLELKSVKQLDADEVRQLANETQEYFAAADKSSAMLEKNDYHTAELLDRAEAALKEVDAKLTLPLTRTMLEEKLRSLANHRKYDLEVAEHFSKLLDKSSPDWETKDLDDTPHALKDYRGKVVVLDFWYSGCGWCICAMPQIKQLTKEFKDQPVAILGMNSDSEESDARRVIDKLELNYPTLKNRTDEDAINEKYHVHGYPTLVLIDQNGIVRDFHVGNSPTLREDMERKIRELLAVPKD